MKRYRMSRAWLLRSSMVNPDQLQDEWLYENETFTVLDVVGNWRRILSAKQTGWIWSLDWMMDSFEVKDK